MGFEEENQKKHELNTLRRAAQVTNKVNSGVKKINSLSPNKGTYRQRQPIENEDDSSLGIRSTPQKLGGPFFYIIAALAAFKDMLDWPTEATVILTILTSLASGMIYMIILIYLILNNVKWTIRKVVTFLLSFVAESVPGLKLLPAATVNLLIIRWIENHERAKKILESDEAQRLIKKLH